VHAVVGNVVEPLVFGQSMQLSPLVILLALMLWGTVWGVTGLVLGVPITAVLRLYLAAIDHPLPCAMANLLGGGGTSSLMTLHSPVHITEVEEAEDAEVDGRVAGWAL
tara:strand:- start:297 stop:620 length:324 start_codon:yes stop_codon:yes gene_type:complete